MFARRFLILFLLFAISSSAPAVDVTILASFEQTCPLSIQRVMKAEVGDIMRAAHVQLEWHHYKESLGKVYSTALVVVRFFGRCEIPGQWSTMMDSPSQILGVTRSSEGQILPFIEVYCDQTVLVVSEEMQRAGPVGGEIVLGRAMGRVLAHELYHVFAQTAAHAPWGLAQQRLRPSDLAEAGSRFEKPDLELMRQRLQSAANPSPISPIGVGFALLDAAEEKRGRDEPAAVGGRAGYRHKHTQAKDCPFCRSFVDRDGPPAK